MGNSRFDADDWASYSSTTQAKSQSQIFKKTSISSDLDPRGFDVRESCDSDANPESTPVILAVDETGSMGYLAEEIIKRGLGTIMKEIYDRKPVTDPHVLCMGVGDAYADRSPIQMTQFEADVAAITGQVENIYLEGNGGGNGGESYVLAWYAAANKTRCDAIVKRGRKGYLFTIGDEPPHMTLTGQQIEQFFGKSGAESVEAKALLDAVSQNWEVFHLMVGSYGHAMPRWKALMGERAIEVSDHTKLAEVIVSTIQVVEGQATVDDVAASWSGDTSVVVRNAVSGLAARAGGSGGVVAL